MLHQDIKSPEPLEPNINQGCIPTGSNLYEGWRV